MRTKECGHHVSRYGCCAAFLFFSVFLVCGSAVASLGVSLHTSVRCVGVHCVCWFLDGFLAHRRVTSAIKYEGQLDERAEYKFCFAVCLKRPMCHRV